MARVNGPAFSLEASGELGRSIVFSKWKGRPYVRQFVIPMNPKSAGQQGIRSMLKFLAKAWAGLSSGIKASYGTLAASRSISPFNEYVSLNQSLWRTFNPPSQATPAAKAHTAATISVQTLTGGIGSVTIALTLTSYTNNWGVAIMRSPTTISTPTWDKVIAVITATTGSVTYVDSPLAAGTYHYRSIAFTDDGVMGTAVADGTATVT